MEERKEISDTIGICVIEESEFSRDYLPRQIIEHFKISELMTGGIIEAVQVPKEITNPDEIIAYFKESNDFLNEAYVNQDGKIIPLGLLTFNGRFARSKKGEQFVDFMRTQGYKGPVVVLNGGAANPDTNLYEMVLSKPLGTQEYYELAKIVRTYSKKL